MKFSNETGCYSEYRHRDARRTKDYCVHNKSHQITEQLGWEIIPEISRFHLKQQLYHLLHRFCTLVLGSQNVNSTQSEHTGAAATRSSHGLLQRLNDMKSLLILAQRILYAISPETISCSNTPCNFELVTKNASKLCCKQKTITLKSGLRISSNSWKQMGRCIQKPSVKFLRENNT